jgi:hypothetical protein
VFVWLFLLLQVTTSKMAVKVGKYIDQACLPALSAHQPSFVPATSALVEADFLQTNVVLAIYFS